MGLQIHPYDLPSYQSEFEFYSMENCDQPILRAQLRLLLGQEIAFGPGKADLLEAIRETGSISGAGKKMGMSYRRAWLLVDAMNRCFKQPLVETCIGGTHGGGTKLTELGEQVLQQFREIQNEIATITDKHIRNFQSILRKKPVPVS